MGLSVFGPDYFSSLLEKFIYGNENPRLRVFVSINKRINYEIDSIESKN